MIWGRFVRFMALDEASWRSPSAAPRDKRELGNAARQLLDDPVLHLALERVEDSLIQTWKTSDPADEEGRERVYATYLGMQRFRGELRRMIANAGDALNPER
jgi:hypothetical protein